MHSSVSNATLILDSHEVTHIIETGRDKEILMLVVSCTSPEVSNLLGLDVLHSERRAVQRRSWNLKDRQRRDQVVKGLSNTRNGRNQRRQAETLLLERSRGGCTHGAEQSRKEKTARHCGCLRQGVQ